GIDDRKRSQLRDRLLLLDADDQVAAVLALRNSVKQLETRVAELQLKLAGMPASLSAPKDDAARAATAKMEAAAKAEAARVEAAKAEVARAEAARAEAAQAEAARAETAKADAARAEAAKADAAKADAARAPRRTSTKTSCRPRRKRRRSSSPKSGGSPRFPPCSRRPSRAAQSLPTRSFPRAFPSGTPKRCAGATSRSASPRWRAAR